jgi:hypothetical protein
VNGKAGDRILVESEHVGTPAREGEILEVIEGELGIRYRVRWSDGHESVLRPMSGVAKVVPSPRKRGGSKAG